MNNKKEDIQLNDESKNNDNINMPLLTIQFNPDTKPIKRISSTKDDIVITCKPFEHIEQYDIDCLDDTTSE